MTEESVTELTLALLAERAAEKPGTTIWAARSHHIADQLMFHSYVRSSGHIVDPGDTLVEGLGMLPLVRGGGGHGEC